MAFLSKDQFGVSGLLYQSDVLLYDRKSESLWSQIMMPTLSIIDVFIQPPAYGNLEFTRALD